MTARVVHLQSPAWWVRVGGVLAWVLATALWVSFLAIQQFSARYTWLLDWHVYAAGARDLLDRTLYQTPLESAYRLPVDAFNYPPLSAAVAVPFLGLPDQLAGTIWVAMSLVAMAAAVVLTARLMEVRDVLAWSGFGFLAYTLHPWFVLALLGNNTPFVLLAVVAFAHEHLAGRERRAGLLLGVAIGLKLWPAFLIPLLLRERRWVSLLWAAGFVAATGIAAILWLGPDSIAPALRAFGVRDQVGGENIVLGFSWLREAFGVPTWLAVAAAIAMVAIPVRGKLGLGLGILAGLAVVPNLWRSYLPTIVVALLLIARGFLDRANREPEPMVAGQAEPSSP
jgi:hypothetical protein